MKRSFVVSLLILAGALCFVLILSARAADGPSPDDREALDRKTIDLMTLLSSGKIDDLLQRISDPSHPHYDELRNRMATLPNVGGKYVDSEIVGFKSLGSRYQAIYVLAHYQKFPALFEIDFYKTNNDWQPVKLHVDTNLQPIIDSLPVERP